MEISSFPSPNADASPPLPSGRKSHFLAGDFSLRVGGAFFSPKYDNVLFPGRAQAPSLEAPPGVEWPFSLKYEST